ncbi:MAG: cation diffusion facilitator family transporter [Hyphomicrobiales bacterium]|nr:cation diffusion facilitator family transporter [Hyphomicrobiales bacterium]
MGSDHKHGTQNTSAAALTKALLLTGSFLIIEVVGALLTGSLALLSDAAHMMTDVAGLAIALVGIKIGARPADSRRTFGYQRFEILAATLNAVLLIAVAGYILYEGVKRFFEPAAIQALPMLAIATAGLIVNLIAMRWLSHGKSESLNVKGAYLEVWSDMLGSLGVIIAAAVIWLTGWTWVDAIVAIAIGLWVLPRTWTLLKETTNVLLEGVPDGLDVNAIAIALKQTSGVQDIHDLHVWAITSSVPSLSAHLVLHDYADPEAARIAARQMLSKRFKIDHVTLQTETTDCRDGRIEHGLH